MALSAAATPITKSANGQLSSSARRAPRNLAGFEDEPGALDAAAKLTLGLGGGGGGGTSPNSPAASLGERPVGTSPDATMLQQSSQSSNQYSNSLSASDFTDQRMRLEKPRTPEQHLGKRAGDASPSRVTDWHRVGHGGDVVTPRNVKGFKIEAEYRGRYTTTNGDYYPPLVYRPSEPVTRELVSDADARDAMQAQRRQRRHQRLSENLAVTQRRLERERLESEAREVRRCQKVNDDMINYSTTVFLNDLKGFKKQPLQMMMKKPNLSKSDHMWGGNLSRHARDEESRDFQTTYSGSFAEPSRMAGGIVPTLNLEDRERAIFGRDYHG